MPHLDPAERVTRAYAAEQARAAKIEADRAENEACIREQIEPDPPAGGCRSCGDPYAPVNENGLCSLCERDKWLDGVKDKLSPEEIYPEHFPDREVEDED